MEALNDGARFSGVWVHWESGSARNTCLYTVFLRSSQSGAISLAWSKYPRPQLENNLTEMDNERCHTSMMWRGRMGMTNLDIV